MQRPNTDNKKCIFTQSNEIVKSSYVSFPTPTKFKQLVKPDFSPIITRQNKVGLKTNGSYKKRAIIEPQSPIKTPSTNYLTPIKIEGKDLFGTKQNNQFCKKLNFDSIEEKEYNLNNITETEMNNFLNKFNLSDSKSNNNINPKKGNINNNILKECNNRMEKDFILLKTLKETNYEAVYIVKDKKTNKLYCIKKYSKKSRKINFNIIQTLFNDMLNKKNNNELGEKFCMKYTDCWIENENYELNKSLYILLDYYSFGDILDYLEKLEENNFKFTSEFYWDIVFEMIIGLLYFHNKGYIHFNIKPTNFIVDNNGYIKLSDFGLSHKIEELSLLDDIIEGDFAYISKELFDNIDNVSISKVDCRCDVFSLGLTFLEIMAKIYLPQNGKLWKDIRSNNFIMPNEFLVNWNIEDNKVFLELINQMISPIDKRPTLIELIKDYPELTKRYKSLKNNKYDKICKITLK